jgi:hypothetical protein
MRYYESVNDYTNKVENLCYKFCDASTKEKQ